MMPILGKAIAGAKRIRRMSARECRVRGGQALRKYAELVLGVGEGELSDRALRGMLAAEWRDGAPDTTVARLLRGLRTRPFMPGLADRDAAVRTMNSRFRADLDHLVARADRAVQGRFDLLGLEDLSFGQPIDWHVEPIAGKRTDLRHWSRIPYLDGGAVGDKKIVWELNRHAHFVTLGQAYWATGDERYADAFVGQCRAWMDANPPGRGINWASALEVSLRSIAWLWALYFFAGSDRLTVPFVWRLLKNLAQHARYLESYPSHYFAPNTHLTGEALGLAYLGAALPCFEAAERWRRLGLTVLVDQLAVQVGPDGVYFEQSSYYHRYTTDFYLHLMLLARQSRIPVPPIVDTAVTGLLDHLMWITRPDGASTIYGDDDGGRLVCFAQRRLSDFRDTLQCGAACYGRRDWKHAAGPARVELLWLLGADGLQAYDALEADAPRAHVRHFESSGAVVLRDGWHPEACYVFFDCGRYGAVNYVHAHADALSIEFAADGVAWIVDPGTYTYTKDRELRDYFRSTAAHNTVVIEGLSQAVPAGPFSWTDVPHAVLTRLALSEEEALAEGEHDGYERLAPPVRHSRTCRLRRRPGRREPASYLVLTDTIRTSGAVHVRSLLHLAPDCHAAIDGCVARVIHSSGKELLVATWRLAADGSRSLLPIRREADWVSPGYGRRDPAATLAAECHTRGGCTLITVAVPCRPGEPVDLDALSRSMPDVLQRESRPVSDTALPVDVGRP